MPLIIHKPKHLQYLIFVPAESTDWRVGVLQKNKYSKPPNFSFFYFGLPLTRNLFLVQMIWIIQSYISVHTETNLGVEIIFPLSKPGMELPAACCQRNKKESQ